jgi:hypothetical protein
LRTLDKIKVEEKETELKEEGRNSLGLQSELEKPKVLSNSKYMH